jgi:hypothetical protein
MLILPLWLPILLTGVALFFASFLSWMVFQLHKHDWRKLEGEDAVLEAMRSVKIAPGSYMLPGMNDPKESQSEDYQRKFQQGPIGVVTIFPGMTMGRNLGLTMVYFLVTSALLAYLARLGLDPGAPFLDVLRFVSTAAFMTHLSGLVSHAIWFRCRIVGHLIESIVYAGIAGAIFAACWPAT